ncbi:MAG: DUF1553 domain-containing protein [Candidatus Hydrogenedentes bacterium]|nr:DUF1553 domain-containing protein [Candidatus Hydrogenedentota bacterium]
MSDSFCPTSQTGRTCLTCLVVLGAIAANATTLAVYPSEVHLDSGRDVQRLIIVETRDDGVTSDVTANAGLSFAPEGLAKWDAAERKLFPIADGETTLTVQCRDQTATVAVHVRNAGVMPKATFRNDVEPVLMKGGCNAGSCHGSAQGKNGFRLTLFGYDPAADYVTLTRQLRGRRVNTAATDESLMLLKPTGKVDHEGGTRFETGSVPYNAVHEWIALGAPPDPADLPTLKGIEILPKNCVLEGEGTTQQFMVLAQYSDGSDRDVTDLTLLSSSDDLTVTVDRSGIAKSGARGETYVMARFGTYAVVSQVIVLPAGLTLQWPETPVKNYVDELVFAKLKKLRVPPAERTSDEVFVRRVYLDIVGVLPTVEETRTFLGDSGADKREKLIEALLQRPEFPELWALKWAELLRVQSGTTQDSKGMYRYNDWLRHAIASNQPIDIIARELLTAEGGNYTQPAANFYLTDSEPPVMAENVAQVFLGVQIKCAQCHNHPFERWTMDDYYSFAAFFAQVGKKASSDPRETVVYNRASGEVTNLRDGRTMPPKFLGGDTPDVAGKDRRAVLAEWLASPENPWFAQNIANRVWAHFFGRGIVEPPDDVRSTNPASNPELLTALAEHLVSYHFDFRQLIRDICASYAYQMSTQPRDPAIVDDRNFSHAPIRRLSAEQLLDALSEATESKVKFAGLPLGARAMQVADGRSGNYFLNLFGRPARETVCTCERRSEPTLGQALHLINGDTIQAAINAPGGRLERLLAVNTAAPAIVEEIYWAALCRAPRAEEKTALDQYLTSAQDSRTALEDVFWSVLNSKEFVFTH